MAEWATAADVQSIAGRNVDPESVRVASYVIDVAAFGGVPQTSISDDDRLRLKLATVFQAVQVDADDGLLERVNAKRVSWPDFTVEFASETQGVKPDPLTIVVAPLAEAQLRALTIAQDKPGTGRIGGAFPDDWDLEARHGVFAE